jgi:hypothetical protein
LISHQTLHRFAGLTNPAKTEELDLAIQHSEQLFNTASSYPTQRAAIQHSEQLFNSA